MMCLIVCLHFLNILESPILIFLIDTSIMLFMIKRLIFHPNYLITLPDHSVPLSDLSNYSLYLSPDRLFTAELIMISWHDYISIVVLTLYDPLIILLFYLRESLGAVTLTIGPFAREFLLGVGET
jgi:hypothetical protein